jgi:hypothetical protein
MVARKKNTAQANGAHSAPQTAAPPRPAPDTRTPGRWPGSGREAGRPPGQRSNSPLACDSAGVHGRYMRCGKRTRADERSEGHRPHGERRDGRASRAPDDGNAAAGQAALAA